jgi:hypothetical protein
MGELRCVDGSVLSVTAVACRDRAGRPFEITLSLARDSAPFASVGQRCGHLLALLADRLGGARADPGQAAEWPDPDDRFPAPPQVPAPETGSYLPGEAEYFALRSRDRTDLPGNGELRCVLRSSAVWTGECAGTGTPGHSSHLRDPGHPGHPGHLGHHVQPGEHGVVPGQHGLRGWPVVRESPAGRGQWRLSRRAVIEAWSAGGIGVRAVLTSAELVAFLDTVLTEPEFALSSGAELTTSQAAGRSGGMTPYWRQRGRVPDANARNRLPALRAQARGSALAAGDPQARRGDV